MPFVTLLKKHTTTTGAAEPAKKQRHIHYLEKYNNILISSLKLADECNFAIIAPYFKIDSLRMVYSKRVYSVMILLKNANVRLKFRLCVSSLYQKSFN